MRAISSFWAQGNSNRSDHKSLLTLFISFTLGLLFALAPILPIMAVPVGDVPHPQTVDGTWVMDAADVLSDRAEAQLNQLLTQLEAKTGTEMAVATVPDFQPLAASSDYATELFNDWELGEAGKSNGVLLLIIEEENIVEVRAGENAKLRLTREESLEIAYQQIRPQLVAGDSDAGVLAGTQAMVHELEKTSIREVIHTLQTSLSSANSYLESGLSRLILALLVLTITTSIVLRKVISGYAHLIQIEPIGLSTCFAQPEQSLSPTTVTALRFLIGQKMLAAKQLSLPTLSAKSFLGLLQASSREVAGHSGGDRSKLVGDRYSYELINSSQKVFKTLFIAALIVSCLFWRQHTALLLPFAPWLWVGYEAWLNEVWIDQATEQTSAAIQKLHNVVQCMFVTGFWGTILTIAIVTTLPLTVLVAVPLVTAFYGAYAGLLRMVRSLPDAPTVSCAECNDTMERLSSRSIQQHLREPERVEVELKTTGYEGWECSNCSFHAKKNDLSVHLFSWVTNNKYQVCPDCEARTVKVTFETVEKPTTTANGTQLISHTCQCCDYTHEREVSIPAIVPTTQSSRAYRSHPDVSGYSYHADEN